MNLSSFRANQTFRVHHTLKAAKKLLGRLSQVKSMSNTFQPPQHQWVDDVEIGFLSLMFVIGCILNFIAVRRAIKGYIQRTKVLHLKDVRSGHLLFNIHLSMSNLFVLLSYCPLTVTWLITYEWPFGDLMCRLANFAWTTAFCIVSNIVASIAIDRATVVSRMLDATNSGKNLVIGGREYMSFVRRLTCGAYVLAVVLSVPQLLLWRQYTFDGWPQCVSEWQLETMSESFNYSFTPLATPFISASVYGFYHALVVFCIPFTIMLACYGLILFRLTRYVCSHKPHRQFTQSNTELMPLSSSIPNSHQNSVDRHPSEAICWRTEMRSKVFRVAAAVVLCYSICWLPYNAVTLMAEIDPHLVPLLVKAEFLKWFIVVNAVANPLIYGFHAD